MFKPLRYHQLTRKQVTIPCVFISLFVALLAWCWKLAVQFKFSVTMEYVSYLGVCHVNLKHCYTSENQEEITDNVNRTTVGNVTEISAVTNNQTTPNEIECARLSSYADLNDITFGLSVYLPVIITLCIFSGSYSRFTKRCAESVEVGNRRRSTLFGRQTISESIIFGRKSVWLGGANGTTGSTGGRRMSKPNQGETIELKNFRPKSDASMGTRIRKVSIASTALDGNITVEDAMRDERETIATPRSVNLFQEGPSLSADVLFENAPQLNRLPSLIVERSTEDQDFEDVEENKPKSKRKFSNNITKHQLATTRCFMVTTLITFVLLTIYLGVDQALKKNTGISEKPWFALSILLILISFVDILVMAVFNSYVRKDVICLFRFCCR
ncbi:hypothetical protein ACHWQZ_G008762 [Mnemiopsis leidyi]